MYGYKKKNIETGLKNSPPHPSFASQNPPSPQGEGFFCCVAVDNYLQNVIIKPYWRG